MAHTQNSGQALRREEMASNPGFHYLAKVITGVRFTDGIEDLDNGLQKAGPPLDESSCTTFDYSSCQPAATEFAASITCVSRVRWLRDLCSAATVSNDLLTFDIVLRYVGLSQTSRWLGPK